MNKKKLIGGIVIFVLAILTVYYLYNLPCEIKPITQEVAGQIIEISQPPQINRLLCISSDPTNLILSVIGSAGLFSGFSLIIVGLFNKR